MKMTLLIFGLVFTGAGFISAKIFLKVWGKNATTGAGTLTTGAGTLTVPLPDGIMAEAVSTSTSLIAVATTELPERFIGAPNRTFGELRVGESGCTSLGFWVSKDRHVWIKPTSIARDSPCAGEFEKERLRVTRTAAGYTVTVDKYKALRAEEEGDDHFRRLGYVRATIEVK